MPHTRSNVFGNFSIKDDFNVERLLSNQTECRFQMALYGKIGRPVESFAELLDGFDSLDGKGTDLLILRNVSKQIQPPTKEHDVIRMSGVGFLLLAVDREINHLHRHFFGDG